jgi:hypothetical protein
MRTDERKSFRRRRHDDYRIQKFAFQVFSRQSTRVLTSTFLSLFVAAKVLHDL